MNIEFIEVVDDISMKISRAIYKKCQFLKYDPNWHWNFINFSDNIMEHFTQERFKGY
jgi:hypothetical protein